MRRWEKETYPERTVWRLVRPSACVFDARVQQNRDDAPATRVYISYRRRPYRRKQARSFFMANQKWAFRAAESWLFDLEHWETIMAIEKCPVCDSPIVNRKDDKLNDAVILESSQSCQECKLYSHDFAYGTLVETICFVPVTRTARHEPHEWKLVTDWLDALIADARTFWSGVCAEKSAEWVGDATGLYGALMEYPGELTPVGALGDWCAENGLHTLGEALSARATNQTFGPSLGIPNKEDALVGGSESDRSEQGSVNL